MGRSAESAHHPHHRNVAGGPWRAAVFGISDGLVSNTSLILGVAGADPSADVVRLAGLAGLFAGAFSMAAGEYISVRSQNDLLQHELRLEAREIKRRPDAERHELAEMYIQRGVDPELARQVATQLMADPDVALEVHAQEELGVTPDALGLPFTAAASSFGSFLVGALLPLVPWFFTSGGAAVCMSLLVAVSTAFAVGWILGAATGGHRLRFAMRQLCIAASAAGVTYVVGGTVGVSL